MQLQSNTYIEMEIQLNRLHKCILNKLPKCDLKIICFTIHEAMFNANCMLREQKKQTQVGKKRYQ